MKSSVLALDLDLQHNRSNCGMPGGIYLDQALALGVLAEDGVFSANEGLFENELEGLTIRSSPNGKTRQKKEKRK